MERLRIKTSSMLLRLEPQEIAFVEADKNNSVIYLCNGKMVRLGCQMHVIEAGLGGLQCSSQFVRVGKSIVVNKNYIYLINLTEERLYLTPTALDKHRDYSGMSAQERLTAARMEDREGRRSVIHASREALAELKTLLESEND